MINIEPSWQELGDIVAEHVFQSNIPTEVKPELGKMISHMATIAHHARVHQLQQQYRDGEIESLPDWAKPDCSKTLDSVKVITSDPQTPFAQWLAERGAEVNGD